MDCIQHVGKRKYQVISIKVGWWGQTVKDVTDINPAVLSAYASTLRGVEPGTQLANLPPQCDVRTAEALKGRKAEANEPTTGVFSFCPNEYWKVCIVIYLTLRKKVLEMCWLTHFG